MMRRRRDAIRPEAAVDEPLVVLVKMVHHGGLVEHYVHAVMRHAERARAPVAEVFRRDKDEAVGGEAKVEVHADVCAAIKEAEPRAELGEGRQRSPAAIISTGTPGHP